MRHLFQLSGEINKPLADRFQSFVSANSGPCSVLIDSIGGNVRQARRVVELIAPRSADFSAHVHGRCFSCAQWISMACGRVTASSNSVIGFHTCQHTESIAANQHELASIASSLQTIDEEIAEMIVARTGILKQSVDQMMAATEGEGTTLEANVACAMGLIDAIDDQASFYPSGSVFRLWDYGPIGTNHYSLGAAKDDARRRGVRCRIVARWPGVNDWKLVATS